MALDFVAFGLLLTGIIIIIAWISEFFSRISRVPNIVFFLLFALLLAPFIIFFGGIYFDPQLFELIISVSLAVIIFEGGYSFNRCISTVESHLPGHRRKECKPLPFRQLLPHILRLTIIAGITTVVLMTLIFIFFIGFPPLLAGLAGTLCAVTGPTVIIPVLRELKVNEDVAETLQGEGGLNDAIFAVTSGAIFAAIMIEATGLINFILIPILIIFDLGIGVLIGLAIGGVGILIAKYIRPLATLRFGALFNQSILVTLDLIGLLCAAILAFGLGKLFGTEAAIIATLIAGILLGQRHRFEKDGENMKLQNNDEAEELIEAEIHSFQLPLTHIAIATIFILAISFTLPSLLAIVSNPIALILGIIVVFLLMLVVRPIAVFVATIRSDFSIRERIFLSLLAPRGVVIAALSLSFVLEIIFNNPLGLGELATLLLWYLIIIVFVSILIEGGLASWIAKKTGVIEPEMKEPET